MRARRSLRSTISLCWMYDDRSLSFLPVRYSPGLDREIHSKNMNLLYLPPLVISSFPIKRDKWTLPTYSMIALHIPINLQVCPDLQIAVEKGLLTLGAKYKNSQILHKGHS